MHPTSRSLLAAGLVTLFASAAAAQGLYIPIPQSGPLPVVVAPDPDDPAVRAEMIRRGDRLRLEREIKQIRAQHFRSVRDQEKRAAGIEKLAGITDPIVFQPLVELLGDEADDVQYGLVRHFADLKNPSGDAALCWMAMRHGKESARTMAEDALLDRVDAQDGVPDTVRRLVESSIRSNVHTHAGAGAHLAQQLQLYELVPTLIVSQVAQQRRGQQGDIAFIAIATQTAFVADLQPVVGDNAVGFDPEIGVVSEGVVLRIRDAVIQVYRYEVNRALIGMTTEDWGESTADMGFDVKAWRDWYLEEYRPYKVAQLEHERQEREAAAAAEAPGA
jgi:hypothetical protein